MGKKLIIILCGIIILVLILLNFSGAFFFLNDYVNTPDKSCNVDTDCMNKVTTCSYCDCGEAVNKNWKEFCPFPNVPMHLLCKTCQGDFDLKCVENKCENV